MRVFVLDAKKRPLDPCHPARARQLLKEGRAAVFLRYPFTIILKNRLLEDSVVHPHRIKIDQGAKTTGLALSRRDIPRVVWAAELEHRGEKIHLCLLERASQRRARRNRKTRYREPRFNNRSRPEGWLPPSLESRVCNVLTWVKRLKQLCPLSAITVELAKFDTQKLRNPETSGIEYQRGTLFGYEVKEYLLEKWERKCAYCKKQGVPLEIDHIIPKSRGGTDRVSNLTLACRKCNQEKGNHIAAEFGHPEVQVTAEKPLKAAAAVNSVRRELYRRLNALGFPVEVGTAAQTKFNRVRLGLPKAHWIDAACAGYSTPENIYIEPGPVLAIKTCGHGRRRRANVNRYGFPTGHAPRAKAFMGYRTGDLVRAVIPDGKYAGTYTGRISIRFRPSFKLNGFDVHPKRLKLLQKGDGYEYKYFAAHSPSQ
ncbi:MAG: HNH endonuclease [Peptococcaceae bacterium]|nr:HNH endonuclease [Peptococcaceae bacterium]